MPDAAIDNTQQPNVTASAPPVEQQSSPVSGQLQSPPIQVPAQPSQPDLSTMQPAAAHVSKLANLGHVASMLLGKQYSYQVDPQTGKTVQTPIQQKPGDIFRHIVAGAILGGAAGAESKGGFGVGLMRGGEATIQNDQQQDELRRKQAQDQFNNQNKARQEQREDQKFTTEQALNKAQIAHLNILTAGENQKMQGESYDLHQKEASNGKIDLQPWLDAGIKPAYQNVPESQMHSIIQNDKNASTMMWRADGVKLGVDANGNPIYEETYSAIDPQGKVKVTADQIKQWKSVGMDKYSDGLFDPKYVSAGREVDAQTMLALQHQYQTLYFRQEKEQANAADISEKQARTNQYNAAAAKDRQETVKLQKDNKNAEVLGDALKEFSSDKVNGDWDKLSPGSRLVLSESGQKLAGEAIQGYKAAIAAQDTEGAQKFLSDYQFWNGLAQRSVQTKVAPPSTGTVAPIDTSTPEGKAVAGFQTSKNEEVAQKQREAQQAIREKMERPAEQPTMVVGLGGYSANPAYDSTEEYLSKHKELTGPQRAAVRKNAITIEAQKITPWDKIGPDEAAIMDMNGKPAGKIPRSALEGYKTQGYQEIPRPQ